jgi:hypothetical protein
MVSNYAGLIFLWSPKPLVYFLTSVKSDVSPFHLNYRMIPCHTMVDAILVFRRIWALVRVTHFGTFKTFQKTHAHIRHCTVSVQSPHHPLQSLPCHCPVIALSSPHHFSITALSLFVSTPSLSCVCKSC